MDFIRLGRTNENASVVGLGCGGHSRLGMARGATTEQAANIVRRAIDLGINFIDTALVYGTEEAVGLAVQSKRDKLFLSTKSWVAKGPAQRTPEFISAQELTHNLESSLKRLKTDYVDVFHLHGVSAAQLTHSHEVLVPEMKKQQQAGKIRFLGITEVFAFDTDHKMFQAALPRDEFDVIMVGFNLLNPSARKTVFPLTMKYDVGTLIMFAVRRALNSVEHTREAAAELIAKHEIDPASVTANDPLDFLRATPGIKSQIEAAYRFCRHEPGAHVILTGTGSAAHLEENVQSILAPPLPAEAQTKLKAIFGNVSSISGN
ncbi:MAG TPA: aldo/keto reductase [Alphaproteobacteria bacterium]|nr:aldo/keto reductase [Alphaproteobacteria bacterium]